jgi:aryl-alcohol dehydrogenase-like predicted oxidoreductase
VVSGDWKWARSIVEAAIGAPENLRVTSPMYGDGASESVLGRVLCQFDATVTTRVHLQPAHFSEVASSASQSVDRNRQRLGRHVLHAVVLDNRTCPAGVAAALTDLVADGKARVVGLTGLRHGVTAIR